MKKALFRFTVVSFSGELIFNGVHGALYYAIFKKNTKKARHKMKLCL